MNKSVAVLAMITALGATFATLPTATASSPTRTGATDFERCTLNAPARLSVWKPSQTMTLTATGRCTRPDAVGQWEIVDDKIGDDWASGVTFNGTSKASWAFDDNIPLGGKTWRPEGAFILKNGGILILQNEAKTDVRLYGAAWIGSKRSGNVVTLTGTALNYSPSANTFVRRAGAVGVFQYRDRSTGTWKTLKQVTTSGSAGQASLTVTAPASREYRFATYSTPTVWTVASASTTR